jgi:hypothetical protein
MQEVAQIRNYVCGLGGDGERGLGGVTDAWRAGLGYNCKMLSLYLCAHGAQPPRMSNKDPVSSWYFVFIQPVPGVRIPTAAKYFTLLVVIRLILI